MKSIDRKPADQNTAQAIKRLQQQIGDLRNEIDSLSKTAITTEEDNILELEPNTFNGNDSPPNSLNSQIYVKQSDGELYYSNSRNVETRLNVDNTTALNAKQDALTFGIADTNVIKCGSGIADDDFLKINSTTLEGRSATEVKTDLSLNNVDNTTDANKPISTATQSALNNKQDTLTLGIANTNSVKIDSASVADDEYARFTASGLESRSNAEVLSDIGALPLAGGTMTGHLNISNADINFSQASLMVNGSGNVDKIYGDGSDIVIAKDDDDVILIKDTETRFEHPVKIKEQASANADSTARGQIWVKNDTPNNLYFTNDAGNDVQITNGASLASGGGASYWTPQWSTRYYTYASNWMSPSTTYGASYYQWNKNNGTSLLTNWVDSNNPVIVVPRNCTLNTYSLLGRATSSETYQLALLTGTPNYGSVGDTSLTQVGSTQTINATANIQNKLEETGLTVSLSQGDILIPMLRRTTNTSATYKFWYAVFVLEATFG